MALLVGDDGELHAGPPGDDDPVRAGHRLIIDRLAFKFEVDQQMLEALEANYQKLAARVAELAATVAVLEALMLS